MRYNQLLPVIAANKPQTIVEIGTWNGLRAILMATEALKHNETVHYEGFDLFEDATPETDARELNVKGHASLAQVKNTLKLFAKDNPGFTFKLHKGDTRERKWLKGEIDFAFIDGGHSVETIQHDYDLVKKAKVVVFDDYYKPEDGHPDIEKFGCNLLVKALPDHLVLPAEDPVKDGGRVAMAITPRKAWPGKTNLVVKTKNCVPPEEIKANIGYAMHRIDTWIPECAAHQGLAVIVSGGPSFEDSIEEIRAKQKAGAFVIAVKHSHDKLIEAGIVPWGCMLLDPRSHVRDFIENPHPDVNYLSASMVHPTTIEKLKAEHAKVFGYHALVGAGEEETIKMFGKHIMIGGGSTSAIRGVSVLIALGFRRFHLYGFDSCYRDKPDLSVKTKTGDQKYFSVNVSGRDFWSDGELIAQAQDFEKLVEQTQLFTELEVFGDGMIPHIWSVARPIRADFGDVFG